MLVAQPRIFLGERFADADQVHDRKQLGLLVVGDFRLAGVGKQPRDMRLAGKERGRRARGEQRIKFAVAQHADQRLVVRDGFQVEARDRLERRAFLAAGLLLAAAAPMNFRRLHAVFVLHHAAHPDHRGDLIFRHADALAAQVLRLLDAGALADVDAGMAEDARHERRHADIGRRCRSRPCGCSWKTKSPRRRIPGI